MLFDKLNYDFIRDITPVASINRIPLVLEAHPSFPAKTVPELIAYAKAITVLVGFRFSGRF